MKKFDVDCDFGGQKSKFTIYIGAPQDGHHPLQFQAKWLSDGKDVIIPDAVMDAVKQLYDLAKKKITCRLRIYVFMLLVLLKKLKLQQMMNGLITMLMMKVMRIKHKLRR